MKRATFNVNYYINRGKCRKDGLALIIARISINKQRAEFAIGRHVNQEDWSVENCCINPFQKTQKKSTRT